MKHNENVIVDTVSRWEILNPDPFFDRSVNAFVACSDYIERLILHIADAADQREDITPHIEKLLKTFADFKIIALAVTIDASKDSHNSH